MMQVNTLCARIENIKQTINTLGSPKSTNPFETVGKYPIKARSISPPAEAHKKWHKSLSKVCNTPNIIMGSQELTQTQTSTQKKELRPCSSQTAD
eukprot:12851837-Ditylum_brightwellii.AAC.1